ncbi:uncharacterized protein KY384_004120 [Bacidia gigantensis]|uniref:uncharacterized protein n=1 Tax=Bacidia gigantensis TaxID=2732470 RepID=UPI001D03B203|nr:uncharacterized protein KY384_004120 [Bacidia gigantensis]KAG8530763.1 hypothetical protein KY384_004120 [Bacidia gigantensis]
MEAISPETARTSTANLTLEQIAAKSVDMSSSQSAEALKDIAFGSLAGAIGKMIEYPFDTVKVRLQSQPLHHPMYSGPLDCFRQSIRSDGVVRGLYRGVAAPIFGAAVETSSLFFSYRISQDLLLATAYKRGYERSDLPMNALLLCGGMSGAFTSLLLTPIELVKCQMQIPPEAGSKRGPPMAKVIGNLFRHYGVLGFWHGQLGTLIRETGGSAAWFGAYEGTSALFRKQNAQKEAASKSSAPELSTSSRPPALPVWQQLVAGASAGVIYNFAFFPADTIKSRMQTEQIGPVVSRAESGVARPNTTGNPKTVFEPELSTGMARQTFWSAGKALWNQQGIRGMYRGCGITVLRAAPSSGFIFAVYEGLRGWWG